jgi:hypothetical protein
VPHVAREMMSSLSRFAMRDAISPPSTSASAQEVFIKRHPVLRLVFTGVLAVATIAYVAPRVTPIYPRAGGSLLQIPRATPDEKAMLLAPWSRLPFQEALNTSTFLRDRTAFALDLVATGKVNLQRALGLADVAVREAYRRQVPPALVLGVMLTENDEIKSTARSRQGAVGLMQIHPGPWRTALGELFGWNLRNDTTNLRYGIYILSHLAQRSAARSPDSALLWRTALLRYNGCVTGKNTRDCHRYPDVVKREVQRSAVRSCDGRDFETCVILPLRLGIRSASS